MVRCQLVASRVNGEGGTAVPAELVIKFFSKLY